MTTTMNLLSVLLSIAMMLSGSAGLEADAPMANSLTIRDVYFEYNDTSFELDPYLTAGVMTDNGTAVFDFGMQCGEESLFPMQLVINEESATLVAEKTGKAFSIDADTINGLVAEALDMDELLADEEFTEALEVLGETLGVTADLEKYAFDEDAINALVTEKLQPVDTSAGIMTYDDVEYQVSSKHYVLDNDQMFELIELVYSSNAEIEKLYDELLKSFNDALAMDAAEDEQIPEVTSIKELYAQMGMTMSLDLTESVSEDGAFAHAGGAITLDIEALDEPFVIDIEAYVVNGIKDVQCRSQYDIDDMEMNMGMVVYEDDSENFFQVLFDIMPVDSDDLTDEDYIDAVSASLGGGYMPLEDGGEAYGFVVELSTYDGGVGFILNGEKDEEGNNTVNFDFEYADESDTMAFGLALDLSKAVFANAAEGLTPIAVDPENIEALGEEFTPVAESLMIDLQTLVEDESVTEMIAALTAIDSYEEITEADDDYEADEDEDEEIPANTELSFNEPTLGYIPEGMVIDDIEIELEYNSVSITLADEDYDNVYYIYVYGDIYTDDRQSFILGEDGALTEIDQRIVSIETEDGAIYAEMQDGLIAVSVSYYGTDLGVDELCKILTGITY